MPLAVWLALGLGAVAVAAAVVADRRRARRSSASRTLVPHRTRLLMAALPSGAIVVGRDRRAAASNTLAVGLGLARPDGALNSEVADLAERAWSTGEPQEADVTVRRVVAGGDATVFVRVSVIDDDLVLALANDGTEQRAAELARREFAVNVSHELKTPVGALVLLAETLESSPGDRKLVREFSAKIGREATRLSKLIQEIIEISRLQGAEIVVERKAVRLKRIAAEAADAVRTAADARGISIAVTAKSSPVVLGDHDLLVMAVRNLVDNAIAYSEDDGSVGIVVEESDGVASIAVIDRGIGIESSETDRIFERFYRTDPARSRATGGTGLGLSIVKHVAAQHGGEVDVWSKPGVGSTFTLRLPAHPRGGES